MVHFLLLSRLRKNALGTQLFSCVNCFDVFQPASSAGRMQGKWGRIEQSGLPFSPWGWRDSVVEGNCVLAVILLSRLPRLFDAPAIAIDGLHQPTTPAAGYPTPPLADGNHSGCAWERRFGERAKFRAVRAWPLPVIMGASLLSAGCCPLTTPQSLPHTLPPCFSTPSRVCLPARFSIQSDSGSGTGCWQLVTAVVSIRPSSPHTTAPTPQTSPIAAGPLHLLRFPPGFDCIQLESPSLGNGSGRLFTSCQPEDGRVASQAENLCPVRACTLDVLIGWLVGASATRLSTWGT